MKKYIILVGLAFVLASCRTVGTGDPVVVTAENVREIATSTFSALWVLEKENRMTLWAVSPDIKHAVDKTRAGAPGWIADLSSAIKAYKASKTDLTKSWVDKSQESLGKETTEAQKQIVDIKTKLTK